MAGTLSRGGFLSRDGGVTWMSSTGLSSSGGPANLFNVVISPDDGNVVWAMGLDVREADANVPSRGRHIYRSENGGETFSRVVDASETVTLVNGPILVADPRNSAVLYFVFGTFVNGFGTDVYRYDHATRALEIFHHPFDGIDAIAFSRTDPSVTYFGLEVFQRSEP